ncbi:hypothetical protein [Pseudoalteromonas sp. S16_S37]|uniref:hypothetical protein n=1 Tax=Pseudoalteromonas sp. S16_S37 TaxID=2720228 RepID=UPI001680D409|nr:hypothetical protein [Pseudoalteromonas sp. S16_S37]MBD1583293.1 hypothetical protein [Pseudoalteromonas sp. S16_S37]
MKIIALLSALFASATVFAQPVDSQFNAFVIEVKKSPLGTRLFKIDNGQSWKQLGNGAFYAKKGDRIEIKRGALDSFFMTKYGSNRSIRVKRVD